MEEKERFTNLHYLDNQIFVYDNKLKSKRVMGTEECFELLNQQDKRIKELEEKYQDLKEDNDATTESLYACRTYLDKNTSKMWELEKENQQLKQSQKQLAIDKMTELYNLTDEIYHSNDMDKEWLLDWLKAEIWKLNQEIKSLKGEK